MNIIDQELLRTHSHVATSRLKGVCGQGELQHRIRRGIRRDFIRAALRLGATPETIEAEWSAAADSAAVQLQNEGKCSA